MRFSAETKSRLVALITALAVVAGIGVAVGVAPAPATAAVASEFSAGNIISDAKFHDSAAMSTAQIQSFLQTQVPTCAPGGNCLKSYKQDTWTRSADAQCAAYTGYSQEAASQIISRVATACGINPQVLLVLLQKEQGLVTSTAPSASKYLKATGFACPDTAPCDAQFAGFYNQVYKAAWQFRYYENNAKNYRYKANTVVNIQYNPNVGCGTQPVYIENQATANLYIYTPYTPNASSLANLYGSGDSCGAYGNRNFWRMFSDWFGSPTGPKTAHGALGTARGVGGGIQLTGWAVDPYISSASAYVWVDVDGNGSPLLANKPLTWIEALYPGYGPNHGFDNIIPASPGSHRVCVLQTNGTSIGCSTVVVPPSNIGVGSFDTISSTLGTINVTGWSVDKTTAAQNYVWVNVDGVGGPFKTNVDLPWTAQLYPGTGIRHGFNLQIPASAGTHEVCIAGTQSLLSCKSITVQSNEAGAVQSVTGVVGGINVAGWNLDQRTSASTYVWVNVDGAGRALKASLPNAAATAAFPALGGSHGYSDKFTASPGKHTVCVAGVLESKSYGCHDVTVPNNEVGNFDTATGVRNGITVSGWSLDQTSSKSTYVFATVDGKAGTVIASKNSLNWMEALYPGVGPNHGFSGTLVSTPGKHEVCIVGTSENVSYGCKTVTVPANEVGYFDSATGVVGGIEVSGWSLDQTNNKSTYVYATVDGKAGTVIAARNPLGWTNTLYPGVGPNHGFATTLAATPGVHEVCIVGTNENVNYGCKTVTVPSKYWSSIDSVKGVAGGVEITGWATEPAKPGIQYLWVDIDGVGTIVAANKTLGWFNTFSPGAGNNHGINAVLPVAAGSHRVCITLTSDNSSLGCSTVTVP